MNQLQLLIDGLSDTSNKHGVAVPTVHEVNPADKINLNALLDQLVCMICESFINTWKNLVRPILKKDLENRLNSAVTSEDLAEYVSWPAFENSLKGIKDSLDSMSENMTKAIDQQANKLVTIIWKIKKKPGFLTQTI